MQILDKNQRKILEFNWQSISELMENVDKLISKLYTEACITTRQLHTIKKLPTLLQTKKLLEILTRKSIGAFNVFVGCLPLTARHHVASLLQNTTGNIN
jgi:hypothetical protein